MRHVTCSIPGPFSDGPLYNDEGELIPGSWPVGLPHLGLQGWRKLGIPSGGRELCDFVCDDDWPLEDIPNGWLSDGDMKWDGVTQDEFDDEGALVSSGIEVLTPTLYSEYNAHLKDENDDPRTEESRVHVILGWPRIRS